MAPPPTPRRRRGCSSPSGLSGRVTCRKARPETAHTIVAALGQRPRSYLAAAVRWSHTAAAAGRGRDRPHTGECQQPPEPSRPCATRALRTARSSPCRKPERPAGASCSRSSTPPWRWWRRRATSAAGVAGRGDDAADLARLLERAARESACSTSGALRRGRVGLGGARRRACSTTTAPTTAALRPRGLRHVRRAEVTVDAADDRRDAGVSDGAADEAFAPSMPALADAADDALARRRDGAAGSTRAAASRVAASRRRLRGRCTTRMRRHRRAAAPAFVRATPAAAARRWRGRRRRRRRPGRPVRSRSRDLTARGGVRAAGSRSRSTRTGCVRPTGARRRPLAHLEIVMPPSRMLAPRLEIPTTELETPTRGGSRAACHAPPRAGATRPPGERRRRRRRRVAAQGRVREAVRQLEHLDCELHVAATVREDAVHARPTTRTWSACSRCWSPRSLPRRCAPAGPPTVAAGPRWARPGRRSRADRACAGGARVALDPAPTGLEADSPADAKRKSAGSAVGVWGKKKKKKTRRVDDGGAVFLRSSPGPCRSPRGAPA